MREDHDIQLLRCVCVGQKCCWAAGPSLVMTYIERNEVLARGFEALLDRGTLFSYGLLSTTQLSPLGWASTRRLLTWTWGIYGMQLTVMERVAGF